LADRIIKNQMIYTGAIQLKTYFKIILSK